MNMQKMSNKMKNMRTVLLMLFATISLSLSAQSVTLSGNVKDKTGEPVIGASVVEKGTTNGTITDFDGNFSLKVSGNKTLVVSYIGMKSQEISVKGKTKIQVTLEDDAQALDEVVVIGYGTSKKKDLTGSVASVQGETLAKVPVTSTAQALTGRLAGVQITTADGSPDAEIQIRVRGGGSVTGDNSPLYIVDGFPVSSINDIAPSDIQSIDVLKDASSTAIYGSQGANGVVIITTKSAKSGKTQVSYNGYVQGKKMANKLDVLDPYEFVLYNYEYYQLRNRESNFTDRYGVWGDLDLYKYQKATDWQEELFGNADLSQSHNLSVTGGTDKTKFSLSGTYTKDGSLMPSNNFERFNLNLKLNHEISKNLKFDINTRLSDTEVNGAGTSGSTYKLRSYEAVVKAPVNGMWDFTEVDTSEMDESEYNTYLNDMMTLKEKSDQYWKRKNQKRFNFTGGLSWDIIKNLTYRVEGGYEYDFEDVKNYWGPYSSNAKNEGENKPMADWDKTNSWQTRIANTLMYKWNLGSKHNFDAMIGQEIVMSGSEENYMKGKYFDTSMSVEKIFANMGLNSGATGAASISSKLSTETKLASFFGRFNYRFDERYLFTFTMRADGSSKFAKGNRWGYFPAAAFAWRMSEENFMENTKEWLSNLKLRLSYGTAGNNRIGNTMYKLDYKSYTGSKFYGVGDTQNPYYVATNSLLPNPDLKWETTVTRNLGIDFGFWNERLTGTFDVYWNSTKDLLIQSAIVAPGYTLKQENVGETSNKGIELSLNGLILKHKDYSLSANFNIGFNKNRVESLADGITEQSYNSGVFGTDIQSTYEYLVRVGQPIGLIYGYVTDGYYTTDDFTGYDATTNTYTLKDGVPTNGLIQWVRPGSLKLKDLDGDGKITASNDRKIIGKTAPKFTGGFGLNATWKGFDLSAMFNFVYGNKIYNADKIVTSQTYTATTNFSNLQSYMNSSNRYTYLDANGQIVTDLATLKAMNEGANAKQYWAPASLGDRTPILHSWAIEDGSFIRLQNLTLGYTIPKNLTQKFACNQLRVYCTLNNVFCLTDYSGYDPEVNSPARSSSSSGVMPGIDFSSYPKSFSWTAGVNLTF